MKKLLRFVCVALLTGAMVVACDDDEAVTTVGPVVPTAPAPIFGSVSGTVSVEGSGLPGVSVNLVGAASQSATTGSSGGYSFGNVPAGTHGVQISGAPADVAFVSTASVVTISTSGQTATADFSGNYIRTSSITGSVTAGGQGVVATVTASGAGMLMSVEAVVGSSNTDGDFTLSGLRAGTYHVAISDVGDIDFPVTTRDVTVGVGLSANVSFSAPGEGPVSDAFLVITSLTDADDEATYSGRVTATVDIERGDSRFEKITLYVDGKEAASQSFGLAPAPAEDAELAAAQQIPFTLSFDSDEYDETGAVTYPNGDHAIVVGLTVQGSTAEAFSNRMEVEFDNADGVHLAVSGLGDGATNSTTGQIWYGGPASVIELTAVPVLYSGGSAASLTLTDFCDAAASTVSAAPFTFSPKCKGTSETEGDNPGETPAFNIAGTRVGVLNDDIFPLYLDYDGPPAPTFYPNPNKREAGWVNLTVDFLGEQKSSNKDGWLNYNSDDAGVGGYQPVLRYAEVPKGEDGLEEAIAAPILTLANLPGESKDANAYCAVVSAVDLLGNESDPLDPKADACMTVAEVMATSNTGVVDDEGTTDVDESMQDVTFSSAMQAGVDVTPPVVEFTGASLAADTTTLSTGTDWVIHVTDRLGVIHSEPLDVGVSRRDAKTTKKLAQQAVGNTSHADSFTVANTSPSPRYAVDVGDAVGVGYHTLTASAKDKAGNVSGSISRVALHDPESAPESRLFLVPGDDSFTYAKTVVMTDNLSIKSYSAVLPLVRVGQLTLKTVTVDAYNAASLTTSRTVQETVKLPYLAIQEGDGAPAEIASFTVTVSDQAGTPSPDAGGTDDLSMPAPADIPQVEGFRGNGAGVFAVEFKARDANKDPVELTATAEMADGNLDSPFSRVDFYGRTGTDDDDDLKFLGSVDTSAATTKLVDAPGRDWIYELEVSAEDYEEIVGDESSSIVALGVSTEKGGSVAVWAVGTTPLDIDGS